MRHHREILKLGLPIAIGQLGTIILTFADTMMVGRYGTSELAAASFVNSVFNLLTMILLGYSYGITPLIAMHHGRGELSEAGAVLRRGLKVNLLFGGGLMTCFALFYFALDHVGQPLELLPLMKPYYLTVWMSVWFVIVFGAIRQFVDGTAATRIPMWFLLSGNLLNILLNWLLIFGVGIFPEWGLFGAGVATLVSRAAMAAGLAALVFFGRKYAPYRSAPSRMVCTGVEIHRRSWPVGAQLGLETFAFTFSAVMAGWLGSVELAAYQVLITLGMLGFTLYYSFGASLNIRISHFLGLSDLSQAASACRSGRNVLLGNATFSSLLFFLGGGTLIGFFTPDIAVVSTAAGIIPALILYQYADAMQVCYANALRATGHVMPMTWIAFFSYLVVGIPSSYVLAFSVGWGLLGIYLSFTLCLFVAAVSFFLFYRRGLQRYASSPR